MKYRTRKKYTRVDHSVTASLPSKFFRYVIFNPSLNYSENWIRIHETDQSRVAGIDASTDYRTFMYSAGASYQHESVRDGLPERLRSDWTAPDAYAQHVLSLHA